MAKLKIVTNEDYESVELTELEEALACKLFIVNSQAHSIDQLDLLSFLEDACEAFEKRSKSFRTAKELIKTLNTIKKFSALDDELKADVSNSLSKAAWHQKPIDPAPKQE